MVRGIRRGVPVVFHFQSVLVYIDFPKENIEKMELTLLPPPHPIIYTPYTIAETALRLPEPLVGRGQVVEFLGEAGLELGELRGGKGG